MKTITLTQGKVALVDDADYEYLAAFKWCANRVGRTFYAMRNELANGRWVAVRMHRVVLAPAHGLQVDHIDGNGLNNQRANLRVATNAQNARNSGVNASNTSGHKGVHWHRRAARWRAQIRVDGRAIHLGYYDDPRDAALAYAEANARYHGAFGRTR